MLFVNGCFFFLLQNVTGDEFIHIMDLLAWSRLSQSLAGQKELMEIVKQHAELSKPFDPENPEDVDRTIFCSLHAVPYLCSAIPSTPFVSYLCDQVSQRDIKIGKRRSSEIKINKKVFFLTNKKV